MDPSPSAGEKPLEERLREMILSNVTIGGQTSPRHSSQQPSHRHQGHTSPQSQRFSHHGSPSRLRNRQPTTPRGGGMHPATPMQSRQSMPHSPSSAGPYRQGRFHNHPRTGPMHQHSSSNPVFHISPDEFRREPFFGSPGGDPARFQQFQHGQAYIQQHPVGFNSPAPAFNGGSAPGHHQRAQAPQHQQSMAFRLQCEFLDQVASTEVPKVEMTQEEMATKEAFRTHLETLCTSALLEVDSTKTLRLALKPFGSISSGFAMQGSDMDLAICLESESRDPIPSGDLKIPRMLEKRLLDKGYGARLLTKTRVPILKICEKPTEELFSALITERKKWEEQPEEEKYPTEEQLLSPTQQSEPGDREKSQSDKPGAASDKASQSAESTGNKQDSSGQTDKPGKSSTPPPQETPADAKPASRPGTAKTDAPKSDAPSDGPKGPPSPKKVWIREKKLGPLDFPKSGVGIQCDINFSTTLGLHNTQLLRCYSLCDARVRPIVLFVKAWAKRRKINSPYSGTLSSYGYVLMVLHFLANVASPPVVPNLQQAWRPPHQGSWNDARNENRYVENYDIRFWKDEEGIAKLAAQGVLSQNRQSPGELLRNFFQYFAVTGGGYAGHGYSPGFQWTQAVLSLRTPGGVVRKAAKGWTGATTTIVKGKEVRNRYLFAIEDPFETDHNVARTVTHNGIIAIRDEFRRAWRIICAVGQGAKPEGGLFDVVEEPLDGEKQQSTEEGTDIKGQGKPVVALPPASLYQPRAEDSTDSRSDAQT